MLLCEWHKTHFTLKRFFFSHVGKTILLCEWNKTHLNLKGFSAVWVLIWWVNLLQCAKGLSHTKHQYDFSPVHSLSACYCPNLYSSHCKDADLLLRSISRSVFWIGRQFANPEHLKDCVSLFLLRCLRIASTSMFAWDLGSSCWNSFHIRTREIHLNSIWQRCVVFLFHFQFVLY